MIPEARPNIPTLPACLDGWLYGLYWPRGVMWTKVSYASLCMDAVELEDALAKKQQALEKIEHAVAQTHLDPAKVTPVPTVDYHIICTGTLGIIIFLV